jgi:photosystem II stability/assembly factor-like uncharacterized protein
MESGVTTNLFAVAVSTRDELMVTGEQGRILESKDGGETWLTQPTITSTTLFSIANRGGSNVWVAGRGGAILRRTDDVETVRLPKPGLPPLLRRSTPKLQSQNSQTPLVIDDGDIPRAVPTIKKPARP